MSNRIFQSVENETSKTKLEVKGKIPTWVNGIFLRNGPAKFEVAHQKMKHWFDGYGMLHNFEIKNGEVSYHNKFLKSESYINDNKKGRITKVEWATPIDPCASIFSKFFSIFKTFTGDNTNVNVAKINGQFFALSDYSTMVEFDKNSLETKGILNFKDKFGTLFMNSSAHPSFDPYTGEIFNTLIDFSPFSKAYLYAIKPNSLERTVLAEFKIEKPIYFHSVALTKDYFVFIEQPTPINIKGIPFARLKNKSYAEYIDWKPEKGNIYHIYNRKTEKMTTIKGDAFFFFHTANCFQSINGKINIDLCKYDNFDVNKMLYLDSLAKDGLPKKYLAKLHRITLDINNQSVTETKLSDEPIELPQFNKQYTFEAYRYIYGLGTNDNDQQFLNQIIKTNIETGKSLVWFKEGHIPSEPIFIANPEAKTEDDGVLISMVLNTNEEVTEFLVLDAKTLEEIALAQTTTRIPPGLHGNFYQN